MTRTTLAGFAAFFVIFAGSCGGSQDSRRIGAADGQVDPGQVRIAGTVAGIDSTRAHRAGDPCSTHPCYATIRIDSVHGYGSGFPHPISAGDSVRARFAFTLAPSDVAVPDLDEPLPGLDEGEAFFADLRALPAPNAGGEPTFVVYGYTTK